MPNYCSNRLIISADTAGQLKAFKKVAFKGGTFLFQNTVPMPEELDHDGPLPEEQKKINQEKYGASDWYEWRKAHWGCRCDLDDDEIEAVDTLGCRLELVFDTPWSPPDKWLHTVASDFPEIYFELHFDEPGNAFKGVICCLGENVADQEMAYGNPRENKPAIYADAMSSQGAVNLGALVHFLNRIVTRLQYEARMTGKGTDYINKHPAVRLFAEQIHHLASAMDYHEAYRICKSMADLAEPEGES